MVKFRIVRRLKYFQERYEHWWLHKWVRAPYDQCPPKFVTKVELQGPPSFIYGEVILHFLDGTESHVRMLDNGAYKPRKVDMQIFTPEEVECVWGLETPKPGMPEEAKR